MNKRLIIAALSAALITSCKTETKTCEPASVELYLVGFTVEETGAAYLLSYKKNGVFDTLVDSSRLAKGLLNAGSDTTIFMRSFTDDYDYRLVLPAMGRVYELKGLTPGNHYTQTFQTSLFNMVAFGCKNTTVSYTLNGQTVGNPKVMTANYNDIYIKR